jgi:hypothetical protein
MHLSSFPLHRFILMIYNFVLVGERDHKTPIRLVDLVKVNINGGPECTEKSLMVAGFILNLEAAFAEMERCWR